MWSKTILTSFCLAVGFSALAIAPMSASAQDSTSGAIAGTVTDVATGEPLAGVTVVITSNAQKNNFSAMTNGKGYFKVTSLSPGDYSVLYIYADIQSKNPAVRVNVGKVSQLYSKIDLTKVGGTIIEFRGNAIIDTTKTTQGVVLDKDFTRNLPIPGNTFEDAIVSAAGAQDDGVGVSFSGSSSLENQYVMDGVNTTGLGYGDVGSPVINEFVEETEVITGGYMAEHGRSTGGVVNVVTQSGTNDFHGAVFASLTNSLLQVENERIESENWIDVESNLAFNLQLGATLKGPIIKDKLWFFVGIAPTLVAVDNQRITKSRTDCRKILDDGELSACRPTEAGFQDGIPDEDENDHFIYDELDRKEQRSQSTQYNFVSKINYSHSPEHAGQLTFSGTPQNSQRLGFNGEPQAVSRNTQRFTTDISGKWTSKLNDAKTTVEAILGIHRSSFKSKSISRAADSANHELLVAGDFGLWAAGNNTLNPTEARESAKTIAGCSKGGAGDKYTFIENCPDTGVGYHTGGTGFLGNEKEQRIALKLNVIQRVEDFAGNHEIKAGIDVEDNFLNKKRKISGDAYFTNRQGGIVNVATSEAASNNIEVFRYVAIAPEGDDSGLFPDTCGRGGGGLGAEDTSKSCNYHPKGDVKGRTLNLASYLQDSWQILPNLTLNVGMRYEEQRLRNAEHLQGTIAQGTGEKIGKNSMLLRNMWAPRLGIIYDWTKEGRSKVYANWGRYYESIPMDINDRSFGGESWMRSTYTTTGQNSQCGEPVENLGGKPAGQGCLDGGQAPAAPERLAGAGILVAPGLKAQYLDETILGAEYEVLEDLKIGIAFQNRRVGRVLEDLSTDNANTYVLANPGSWPQEEEDALQDRINNSTDAAEKERLEDQLEQFRGIRQFDAPRREYNAVTLTASKRFSRKFFILSSYVYSRTEGNYQGLFSSQNGQVDPNITSLFDLPELMANRDGPLPQDKPHFFKFQGVYSFDFKEAGELITSASLSAQSGTPVNATGAHYLYGRNETMLLPRGAMGRIDFDLQANFHVGYIRDLGKGMSLEGYVDFFNVDSFGFLGGQGTRSVDQTYTFRNVNPVVGGRYEDLVYLKELDPQTGAERNVPVRRNRNFGNQTSTYAAPWAKIGARLLF